MIVTHNRNTGEWLAMFDDVLLAQSAVDRCPMTLRNGGPESFWADA